ncbi:hypothetical protein [Phocoenobacter skyensis]|uniref:Uncharacterized protein n=1 Tax=Phocoenobacter skyensis TaxID=97481 RepID=A0A1H7TUS6_9PAST|nr:hypothetical protein [Pasteurella skyensis]MDP8078623.1 hypothetical protein [Pasteurella skyensis]MDP8084617.1 hypothetical protein [Pasteurella skyensis]MDP8184237.1 hypothetical protein [Pasteurella skyensis]QLB22887.1 hypothetical protein A6B44_06575 [Pasteurella skyensis]SEL88620.1 hypothetical protein SAMN05444853_10130 [Pasteurella skyensis]
MNIFVNNTEVRISEVSYRELNFGQLRNYTKLYPYKVKIPNNEFIKVFNNYYNKFVEELRIDDAMYDDFEPPYKGATDYPQIEELLYLNSQQLTEWLDFLQDELFIFYLAKKNYNNVKYFLLTWDKVEFIDGVFVVSGFADCPTRTVAYDGSIGLN